MGKEIENVSDTALWVATYRAKESERPDALFRDPLAGVLAGERGRRIAALMTYGRIMSWIMVIRTVAIDRLIEQAIGHGADTVINLGTGLDTRPYRMSLPSSLRWVEVDFPQIINLKNEKLKNETPRCRLERIALDLANGEERLRLFGKLSAEAGKAVIITEGVLPYLEEAEVVSLGRELYAQPHFHFWIQDFHQGKPRVPRKWVKNLAASPFKFSTPDWFGFFGKLGWHPRTIVLAADEGERIGRPLPFPFRFLAYLIPPRKREALRKRGGYILLERA